MVKKKFGQTKILVKKVLAHKKFSFKKIFCLKRNFGQRNFCENYFSIKKVLVKKNFGPKCFRFLSKKSGRVNPGAGIYDPPPPENRRVKIAWNCC